MHAATQQISSSTKKIIALTLSSEIKNSVIKNSEIINHESISKPANVNSTAHAQSITSNSNASYTNLARLVASCGDCV
jgi:hypothetical protein